MRASQAVAVGVAAWLTAAGVGSAMTWAVISRAGSEVVTPSPTAAREPGSARATQPDRRDAPSRPRRSRRSPDLPGAGEPSSPSGRGQELVPPSSTSSPTSSPAPPSPSSPDPTPSASGSSSSPTSTSSPGTDHQRTWQGPGGTVVVTCRGERIELDAAQPDSGYQVEVRDRGPDEVEVDFEGQGTNEDADTRVEATCESGEPRFDADVERG